MNHEQAIRELSSTLAAEVEAMQDLYHWVQRVPRDAVLYLDFVTRIAAAEEAANETKLQIWRHQLALIQGDGA